MGAWKALNELGETFQIATGTSIGSINAGFYVQHDFEAAWQLCSRGIQVRLVEMKPERYSPAHHSPGFAELVCSNSLRSDMLTNAVGLLKEEMRVCGSLIMAAADASRVPAGGALAVDRERFSGMITEHLREILR